MSESIIVCNSGPLIALVGIQHLYLLEKLYGQILVPDAVYEEITYSVSLPGAAEIMNASFLHRTQLSSPLDPLLSGQLGLGEAAAIALALEKQADRVLLDDRKARRIAGLVYRLVVTGTCGILLKSKACGYIKSIRPLLLTMRQNGYYLADHLIEEICRKAGESKSGLHT